MYVARCTLQDLACTIQVSGFRLQAPGYKGVEGSTADPGDSARDRDPKQGDCGGESGGPCIARQPPPPLQLRHVAQIPRVIHGGGVAEPVGGCPRGRCASVLQAARVRPEKSGETAFGWSSFKNKIMNVYQVHRFLTMNICQKARQNLWNTFSSVCWTRTPPTAHIRELVVAIPRASGKMSLEIVRRPI